MSSSVVWTGFCSYPQRKGSLITAQLLATASFALSMAALLTCNYVSQDFNSRRALYWSAVKGSYGFAGVGFFSSSAPHQGKCVVYEREDMDGAFKAGRAFAIISVVIGFCAMAMTLALGCYKVSEPGRFHLLRLLFLVCAIFNVLAVGLTLASDSCNRYPDGGCEPHMGAGFSAAVAVFWCVCICLARPSTDTEITEKPAPITNSAASATEA